MLSVQSDPFRTENTAEYPAPRADCDPSRSHAVWLGICLLVVLAAVPRFLLAARAVPICDDGYFYLAVAEALDQGEFETALWYLNVNIYPVLLVAMDGLGLAVLPAAKYWGVTLGALTVLPLFGWIRRLLDDKTAFAAAAIYAMHPAFIEISSEPIRDSTFWFLMALSLYFSWRAAQEVRLGMFAAAGLAVALAAHTRTEGWLLGLPMIAWPVIRFGDATRAKRIRLGLGMLLAAAMTPALLLAYNLTILHNYPHWELGKLEHFRMVLEWIGPEEAPDPPTPPPVASAIPKSIPASPPRIETPAAAATIPPAAPPPPSGGQASEQSPGWFSVSYEYVDSLVQTLKPVPLMLMLIGAIAGRRLLLQRENLILSAMLVAICLGVWIRLTTLGEINGRYFLACFFPAAGSCGLGLVAVIRAVERLTQRYTRVPAAKWSAVGLAMVIGVLHVSDVLGDTHPSRLREARIGRALGEELGGSLEIITLPHAARVGYYANGELPSIILDDTPIEILVEDTRADVVILEHEFTHERNCADIASQLLCREWRRHDITHIPDSEHFLVFVKPPKTTRAASSLREASGKNR